MKTSSSLLEPRARGVVELGCRVTVREAQSRQVHTITLVTLAKPTPSAIASRPTPR
jgi:transcription elongation GreA/GreB family factor